MTAANFSGIACVLDRVEDEVRPTGTAFLISSQHAITALHVVSQIEGQVVLRFMSGSDAELVAAREIPELRDEAHDYAILRCDRAPPSAAVPFELAAAHASSRWMTKGYLVGRREDALTITGEIQDLHAQDRGVQAIQLFSQQLVDGTNASGLSGAPCIVDGRAVALIRSVFSQIQGRTSAGTLYATPMAVISAGILPRLKGAREDELVELRDRLRAVRPSVAFVRVVHAAAVCLAILIALTFSFGEIQIVLLDHRSLPAERVEVELRDCIRGSLPGMSNELGSVQFTVFRWCATHQITLENYAGKNERVFPLTNRPFFASRKIACRIFDGENIRCR